MIQLLASMEEAHYRMLDLLDGTPINGRPSKAWDKLKKAIHVMRSALENEIFTQYPDVGEQAGFPHYNLVPLGDHASRFIAKHGRSKS